MGRLEEKSRKRTRNQKLQALVLGSVAVAGGLAVALVAPNVLGAMVKLGLVPKFREEEYIRAAQRRMMKAGLIRSEGGFLRVTTRGQARLATLSLSLARPQRLKRWDGKWRVLIFDIPERRRGVREAIRNQLHSAGFIRVQDSVWLYPYPCEEYVALLKANVKVGKDMLYLIVDSMEKDMQFRKEFGLRISKDDISPPVKLPKLVELILDPILPKHDNT